ncbi:segment polarity protein dishevelled-like DVL-3 [Silurus asotus]|uniref:Segment polarity protein dishevelled-like DVL-3 n=1 Tax=Silurus asotus TaxID=30991 RepID=A0AAD5B8F2_SILAS|nr:segment polarity protein dishevelled-like DVL-3 [Silurus asotus]
MGETKIIYHLDDQETPYLVKVPVPAEEVTLAHFKQVLNKPNYKFFFKSMDDDFGVVKEEISDDNTKLPCFNGRVVSWLVSADGSHGSDGGSVCAETQADLPPVERTGVIGDSRPPSFHANAVGSQDNLDKETEADVGTSVRRDRERERERERPRRKETHEHGGRLNGHSRAERRPEIAGYETSSTLMSSELDTTSFFDSEEDDATSRFSSSTGQSTSSRLMRRHRRRRRKTKPPRMERSSSFSSITDSTMSLNIITVTLNMEKYNFLGISIVGQSNERGDGGIYIGSIMKGGAVAADGRIEPGDMLLQVNDINFENMSNDDAVRVLREIVHKPGPITLTVAKCWDPNPRSCFTLPRSEPIRPIDPAAWVSHTAAMTGAYPVYGLSPSMSTITSTSSSITSSIPETERFEEFHLSIHSDMATVAKAMASPESGLEVRDRMWLKITIPNAFIGSDVVDWLYHHVEGFTDRREARKYASNLLKAGYIRHTVNKITFSEQCYYIFGDLCGNMANLSLHDHDGSSASDQDTLAPLPHPGAAPWPFAFPYQYPLPQPYSPHPVQDQAYSSAGAGGGGGGGSAGSPHSEVSTYSNKALLAFLPHLECVLEVFFSKSVKQLGSPQWCQNELNLNVGEEGEVSRSQICRVGRVRSGSRSSGSNRSANKAGGLETKSGGSGSETEKREKAPSERSTVPPSEHSIHSTHSALSQGQNSSYGLPAAAVPGSPQGRDLASVPPELTASRQSFRMAMGNPSEFFVDVM